MKKLLFTFSLLLFTILVARAATIDVTQANVGNCRTLEKGNTYRFAGNVTYNVATEGTKDVTVTEVTKPSDAAGFFSIGVKATSDVNSSDAPHSPVTILETGL